jgi:glyoxylase-like metal-dependent hydrolase (beta-lactamase superfamily II)
MVILQLLTEHEMKISLFNISNFRVDGGAMFGVIPKALWSRQAASDENNTIDLSLTSLVIDTGGRVILVDSGWGDKQDAKFFRHAYLHDGSGLTGGLAECGYLPDDITDVIITHLHADHCGGCFVNAPRGGQAALFPNASYHISRVQWEWANDSNLREEDAFLPENIKPFGENGKLNLVEDNGELCPGVRLRLFYGHTPGLMLPEIDYRGRRLFYVGDLIPTVSHIPLLWNMAYDLLPLVTIAEKQEILEEALRDDCLLVFQHDPETECCSLTETPKGIRAGRKGKLSDFV